MNKQEIIDALKAAGIAFDSNATVAVLKALYDQHIGGNVITGSSVKENAPETVSLLIEVTDVQEIEQKSLVIVSGVDAMGQEQSFPIQEKYWKAIKGKDWVKIGAIVSVKAEKRVKDKTTYLDADTGDLAYHTKDGLSVSRMNLGSKANFKAVQEDASSARSLEYKLAMQNQFIQALQAASEAGVDQMALASLLKG